MSPLLRPIQSSPRCNNDIFEAVTTHFAENTMDDLESIDVSSLANAFSRVALTHKVCWAKISQRLRADASSALLPPAAATMALNAFAVVKQCDSELFMSVVESSIRPGASLGACPAELGAAAAIGRAKGF